MLEQQNAETTETPTTPAADRESILAELKALRDTESSAPADDEGPAPARAPAKPAAPAVDEDDDDDLDDEDTQPEAVDEDDDDDLDDEDDDAPAKPDPAAAKGLAAVQKAEKRAREAAARAREEVAAKERALEEDRKAWQAEKAKHVEKLARFERLAERATIDPAAVLAELGVDDFDWAARQVFARSPEAQKDPKNRDAVARSQRDREKEERIAKLEKRAEELEDREKKRLDEAQQREQQDADTRAAENFIEGVAKAVTDETPLVQKMLAANPQRTRARLAEVTQRLLAKKPDTVPSPRKVARVLERQRRAELEELGVDVSAIAKAPAAAKKNGKAGTAAKPTPGAVDEKPPARSRAASAEDERAAIVEELRALNKPQS